MKTRWAPRWYAYVGLGPNPALPRPMGDSMTKAFYNCTEKSVLGPPDVQAGAPTYVYIAIDRRTPNSFVVFKTEHFAKQWILSLLKDSQHWEIHSYQVYEDEE